MKNLLLITLVGLLIIPAVSFTQEKKLTEEEAQKMIAEYRARESAAKEKISALEAEIAKLKEEIAELESKVSALKTEIDELNAKIAEIQKKTQKKRIGMRLLLKPFVLAKAW